MTDKNCRDLLNRLAGYLLDTPQVEHFEVKKINDEHIQVHARKGDKYKGVENNIYPKRLECLNKTVCWPYDSPFNIMLEITEALERQPQ